MVVFFEPYEEVDLQPDQLKPCLILIPYESRELYMKLMNVREFESDEIKKDVIDKIFDNYEEVLLSNKDLDNETARE